MKRQAFALTLVFLRTNGFRISVTADEGEGFLVVRVIQGKAELDEIAGWIERFARQDDS